LTNPVRFTVVASSSLPSQLELPAQLELMGYDICYAGQSTRFEPFVYATLCSEARGSELVVRIDRRPGVLEVSTYVVVLPEQKPHHEVIEWRAILLRRKSPNGTKRRSAAAH